MGISMYMCLYACVIGIESICGRVRFRVCSDMNARKCMYVCMHMQVLVCLVSYPLVYLCLSVCESISVAYVIYYLYICGCVCLCKSVIGYVSVYEGS